MEKIHLHSKVGEIVAEDYRTAGIFKKYGIDFCCGGGQTLEEACRRRHIAFDELAGALALAAESTMRAGRENFNKWDPAFLIDFIINKHHLYVREKLPELQAYADKVARVHGERHPETVEIARHWRALAEELTNHMAKEENILFPAIKGMIQAGKQQRSAPATPFGSVRNPIHVMELEHDAAGKHMRQISELSDGFTPPPDACMTYRVLYAGLAEFEENLHEHVHLENNILFPRAIDMEEADSGRD